MVVLQGRVGWRNHGLRDDKVVRVDTELETSHRLVRQKQHRKRDSETSDAMVLEECET